MHRAGAADRHATAEFGTGEPDRVANHPEQWGIRLGFDGMFLTVNVNCIFCHDADGLVAQPIAKMYVWLQAQK